MFSKKNRNRNFKEPKYFSLERFFFSTTDVSSLLFFIWCNIKCF